MTQSRLRRIRSARAPFDPDQLFYRGEGGTLPVIPSLAEQTASPVLYEDAAGTTTPVDALGDPVGYVADQSGNGNNATQSTSTARMLYARMPRGGVRNLLTYTEQFDNAAWAKTFVTITPDTTTAPDGEATADKLVEAAANNLHFLAQNSYNFISGVTYTGSCFMKSAGDGRLGQLAFSGSAFPVLGRKARFDLDLGVTTLVDAGVVAEIEDVGDGWYRCSITVTANATASAYILSVALYNGGESYLGDGTSGIYIWGAQSEVGSAPTAYQKVTSASDVTQEGVADVYYLKADGADDFLTFGVPEMGNTSLFCEAGQSFCVGVAFWQPAGAGSGTLVGKGGATLGDRTFVVGAARTTGLLTAVVRGTANNIAIPNYSTSGLGIAIYNWDGAALTLMVNSLTPTALTVGSAAEETGENILLGARTTAAPVVPLNGGMIDTLILDRSASLTERQTLMRYWAHQVGVTL